MNKFLTSAVGELDMRSTSCAAAAKWLLQITGPLKTIEIGTAYGRELQIFADLTSELVCVDMMYDWVPDLKPGEPFDLTKVDRQKLAAWQAERAKISKPVYLVVGSSYEVHDDAQYTEQLFSGSQLLIVDGCHHPREAVMQDYLNFEKHMTQNHYVIWDDMNDGDCHAGCDMARADLLKRGHSVDGLRIREAEVWLVQKK